MTHEAQLVAAIAALWGSAVSLAGLVYRIQEHRITEWRDRAKHYESEAKVAMDAMKEEVAEWRRLALLNHTT